MSRWVFGYGSLIWRPGFDYLDRRPARLDGWARRFWQGSHDHRGVPDAPGRVVTLIEQPGERCDGVAYLLDDAVRRRVFEQLDYREKNGYRRYTLPLRFADGARRDGLVYVAPADNDAYLGPAAPAAIAEQILSSRGPSGANVDYLLELARTLRELDADDRHVFELEALVKKAAT